MFAKEDFIVASRKFVCIRIETYENKEAEKKVRALLNGAYANTAFCIFDPTGRKRITRSGRSPSQGMGRGTGDEGVIRQMNLISASYKPTGRKEDTLLQDFHSFRQALNVASADQRLLVLVDADKKKLKPVQANLKKVFADSEVEGKFHLKFVDKKTDKNWAKSLDGKKNGESILVIRSGQFGIDGTVLKQLPLTSEPEEIKSELLAANENFASVEDRKTYSKHVMTGRRQRVYFENEIPYGEDRDGDGEKDARRGGGDRDARRGGEKSGQRRGRGR